MKKTLIIGGSPCAGKSSVSTYIANRLGYQHIRIDDFMGKHIDESDSEMHPVLNKWKTSPWHELFSRASEIQLEEEIQFYEEEWNLIKRDIFRAINNDKVIIEGCGLLPSKVESLFDESCVVYMVPDEEFQVEKYKQRDWAFELLKDAEDIQDAFNKWMERDIKYAKYIRKEAKSRGFKTIVVDGYKSIEETANELIKDFELK